MFKHLDERVLGVILRLFNKVWALGKLPCGWKHLIVIPILEDGKDSTSPIFISSDFSCFSYLQINGEDGEQSLGFLPGKEQSPV